MGWESYKPIEASDAPKKRKHDVSYVDDVICLKILMGAINSILFLIMQHMSTKSIQFDLHARLQVMASISVLYVENVISLSNKYLNYETNSFPSIT